MSGEQRMMSGPVQGAIRQTRHFRWDAYCSFCITLVFSLGCGGLGLLERSLLWSTFLRKGKMKIVRSDKIQHCKVKCDSVGWGAGRVLFSWFNKGKEKSDWRQCKFGGSSYCYCPWTRHLTQMPCVSERWVVVGEAVVGWLPLFPSAIGS